MTTVILTILVLGVLVLVHELGHFAAARAADIRVDEFSIGFGPALFSTKPDETEYSVRAIPLGGYVRMAGMQPGEEEQPTHGRGLREKSILQRMSVFSAGPAMNFMAAALLFFIVFGLVGIDSPTLVVDELKPGLPAEQAGLQEGDRILRVDGSPVGEWPELVKLIQAHPGETLSFTVERGERTMVLDVTPVARGEGGQGFIGLLPEFKRSRLPAAEALKRAVGLTVAIVANFVQALSQLFSGQGSPEFIGIVGIGAQIGQATELGLPNLLFFAAVLSASFGLINLLPIPALDGSHLLFLVLEKLRGRPIDPEKEGLIHFVGFALIMLLALFITYQDILRLI
jgi:regulator of sigma E protease